MTAGDSGATQPVPLEIRLRKNSRLLVVQFEDGSEFAYSFEYLRVFSPSAEVVGHGPGQETLQTGKEDVVITAIDPVGHYAVRLVFDLAQAGEVVVDQIGFSDLDPAFLRARVEG